MLSFVLYRFLALILHEEVGGYLWESSLAMRTLCNVNKETRSIWERFKNDHQDRATLIERFAARTYIVMQVEKYWTHSLYGCLKIEGYVTPECGRQWYMTHLEGEDLYKALKDTSLLSADLGRRWFAKHCLFGCVVEEMESFGLLTTECGVEGQIACCRECAPTCKADWYVKHMPKARLLDALRGAGLLTIDLGLGWLSNNLCNLMYEDGSNCDLVRAMDQLGMPFPNDRSWYIRHLHFEEAHDVMNDVGLLTAECGIDWYVQNINDKEWLLNFLKTANILPNDRDFYTKHFTNLALYRGLKFASLLIADHGRDWYSSHFQGSFLLSVLEEVGL